MSYKPCPAFEDSGVEFATPFISHHKLLRITVSTFAPSAPFC